MAYKYAYMMESTYPEQFAQMQDQLPAVSEQKRHLARQIGSIHMAWSEACAERYPILASRGRPLHTSEDSREQTSSETYLQGELYTYSERTLELYLEDSVQAQDEDRNLCEEVLDHEVRAYGYASIGDYEASQRNRK